jgi:8-oxo-dGTP pyrophosphatase MutT (NUDIX family)
VREETGLLAKPLRKLCEMDSNDGKIRLHWWIANAASLNVTMNDEHSEMGWFTLNEMENLSPIFHEDVELFRSLR